jgi:PTS system ascorbate-specific IIB component
MKKILVVCGNGLGSSFIIEMNVKNVLKELGIEAEVSHTDLADLVEVLDDGTRNVAKLTNILDLDELRSVLEKHL